MPVSAVPEGATWGLPAWKTARVVKSLRMTAIVVQAAQATLTLAIRTLAMLTRMSPALTLVPPEVSPTRVVARSARVKVPLSACPAGS
jgi:hypothetical protein